MLNIVLGRAGAGKTTYIRELIAEKIDSNEEVILIVPEQYSFESEKAMLEHLGVKTAAKMKTLSFSSLAKDILNRFCPVRKPSVGNASKNVIMSMALEALSEKLNVFSKCMKSRKSVPELLSMTDEIIQSNESLSEMLIAAEKTGNELLREKVSELTLICSTYETMLTASFSDDRYALNEAARIISEEKLFEGKCVFFDEFTGFTAQENLIIAEILKQAKDVYAVFCAIGLSDSSVGTGAFSYPTENVSSLIALAKKVGAKVAEPVIFSSRKKQTDSALSFIENGIYEPLPDIYDKDTDRVTIISGQNPYDEADYVALTAKKLVRENGYRYRDIVIIGRGSEYKKYLPFAFKKYDIPVFEDTRRSLGEELICIFSLAALSLAVGGFSTDAMLMYLKAGLSGISRDDVCLLENYAYIYDIDYSGWTREWVSHPDGFGNTASEESDERLAKINEIRQRAVLPVLKLKKDLADTDGYGCVKALYEFLEGVSAGENLLSFAKRLDETKAYECERSWDEFMSLLSSLADCIGQRAISPERFLELLKIAVSASDIGSIPTGLDEITFGDADRIRVGDKKAVFIIGANEGVFPQGPSESFVLTDAERRILKNQGIALGGDNADKMRKERHRIYTSLAVATERLYISYSVSSVSGEELMPGEIVMAVEKIVPQCKRVKSGALSIEDRIESNQSAFEQAAMHYSDYTPQANAVKAYAHQAVELSDKIECVKRAVNAQDKKIENEDTARALFGRDIYVSASKVEEFYKCPFKYFCKYGLRAYPIQKAVFDPRQNGLIVHSVLENVFREYKSEQIKNMSRGDRREIVDKYTDEYILSRIGSLEEIGGRLKYSLDRCKLVICEILERLSAELSVSLFETRDVELAIGVGEKEVDYYSVSLPDGSKAFIGGVVDRVDTYASNGGITYLRVVDYKTGGKDFVLSDIVSGQNLQMLLYLTCLYENGKDRYGETVPAGVLYVPAKKSKNSLGRNATQAEIEQTRISQGKMQGIVLENEEVIRAMEEDGGGVIIDAKIDKNGAIKGKTFNMDNFFLIHKAIDKLIGNMAQSLHNGKIEIMPLYEKNKTACDYCDYSAVCAHEDDGCYKTKFEGEPWQALEEMCNE